MLRHVWRHWPNRVASASRALSAEHIGDRLSYAFEDIGGQSVKNIARPVRIYALRPEAIADLPAPNVAPAPLISQPPVAPRLSIVVLPFTNLSDDPGAAV